MMSMHGRSDGDGDGALCGHRLNVNMTALRTRWPENKEGLDGWRLEAALGDSPGRSPPASVGNANTSNK